MTVSNTTNTNQASELYELCKKVYELTEWECDGEYVYHHNDLVNIVQGKPAGDYWENNWWFPLYTSDYLLEKLPRTVKDAMHEDAYLMLYPKGKVWKADYIGMFMEAKGDTPLLALLKLTIALSEAGELK